MKFSLNYILRFVLLSLVLVSPSLIKAAISTQMYDFTTGGVYYKYVRDNNRVIIGVEACSKGSDTKTDSGYSGNVVIPSEATDNNGNTYTVIGIAKRFCAENRYITSISIPPTVTYIGVAAFTESGLTSITIPANSSLRTIGDDAFSETEISSLTIPEGVTVIPRNMCWGCRKLTSVTLPNSTIQVLRDAFDPGMIYHENRDDEYLPKTISSLTMPSGIDFENNFIPVVSTAKIYCTSNNPLPQKSGIFSNSVYTGGSLYVRSGLTNIYRATQYWNQFSSINTYTLPSKDIIQCNDITVKPDATATLTISSSITESYRGFQFDLILPGNMKFSSAKLNDQLTSNGWSAVKTYKYSDNIIRIQALPENNTQSASSLKDKLIELTLTADEQAAENSEINISNFTFLNTSNSVIYTYNKVSKVTIVDIPIFSVNWSENFGEPSLREGETLALSAMYTPSVTEMASFSWASSEPTVATVDSNGLVTAKGAGVTKITVTAKNSLNEKSNSLYITVTEPLWGDANDNGVVNVADVITIGNSIANRKVDKFFKITADINKDNSIDISDLTATVNIILGKNKTATRAPHSYNESSNDFLFTLEPTYRVDGNTTVNINLANGYPYSALQADVIVPDGMVVRKVSLGEKASNHDLIYNVDEENILKIVIYSILNTPFSDFDSNLFNIELTTNDNSGDLFVENIIASDDLGNRYSLSFSGDCYVGTTAVSEIKTQSPIVKTLNGYINILNADGYLISIYDIAGHMINHFTASSDNVLYKISTGIYIVQIKGRAFKVNVN